MPEIFLRYACDILERFVPYIGCPEKNAPQFLLNFSDYKHAIRLGHDSMERWDP